MPKPRTAKGASARWRAPHDASFCPVSTTFIRNLGALDLTATQAMLVIDILSYKLGDSAPYPKQSTLARHLGVSESTVHRNLVALQRRGLLRMERSSPRAQNRYFFDGLYDALDRLASTRRG